MSESAQSIPQPHGYNFHDPAFVEWWLGSLYLLPIDQQVAAAQAIKRVVMVPAVHAEADAFLANMGEGPLAKNPHDDGSFFEGEPMSLQASAPIGSEEDKPIDVVAHTIRRFMRDRPAFIWLGVLSLVVLAMRGIQVLVRFAA